MHRVFDQAEAFWLVKIGYYDFSRRLNLRVVGLTLGVILIARHLQLCQEPCAAIVVVFVDLFV